MQTPVGTTCAKASGMQTQVLQWEMYGRGTAVQFSAMKDDGGFGLMIRRDDEVLISSSARDGQTLLRKSTQLRQCLQRLGFESKPMLDQACHMAGGLCWGPATPLQSSIIEAALG